MLQAILNNFELQLSHRSDKFSVSGLLREKLRHAFVDERKGTIRIAARRVGEKDILVSVEDDGVGLPAGVDPARPTSLGLRLVRRLARQAEAEIDFVRDGGTRVSLRLRSG